MPDASAEEIPADGDLYAVPSPIPDVPHGTLLRYQLVEPSVHAGATTYRMMYASESHAGEPIVVTGVAVIPDAEPPADGRDTITLVHGTTGSADVCAPSKNLAGAGELALLGPSVAAGTIIAATDYEGMGTPGVHPYLMGESEGRSGLDAALAARQLPGAQAGTQLGVMGYSQGGHSAMWTAELAETWAPELDLVGTFAGAPPTEIGLIAGARITGAAGSFVLLLVNGYEQAYGDEIDPAEYLSVEGLSLLPLADEQCVGDLSATAAAEFTSADYAPDAGASGPWQELTAANDAGTVAVGAPLLIVHSSTDDVVPAVLSDTATTRLCGLGQVVERRAPTSAATAPPPSLPTSRPRSGCRPASTAADPAPISTC
ncbi:MAG: lipase family protein [Ilumatobacteraceae bacterium]